MLGQYKERLENYRRENYVDPISVANTFGFEIVSQVCEATSTPRRVDRRNAEYGLRR